MTKKAKGQYTVLAHYGRLHERDPNRGIVLHCYVCGTPHKAFGIVRIEDGRRTTDRPLCEACLEAKDGGAVIRKYWNAPDLEVEEGGKVTTEQIQAMVEKPDKTEH